MSKMEYLKDMPVAVLGGGAVGKTCAADIKLAGREVRLYDVMPFAENPSRTSIKPEFFLMASNATVTALSAAAAHSSTL